MGFNIEATAGTGEFLKANGVRTRIRGKLSEGSTETLDVIRAGYPSYAIKPVSYYFRFFQFCIQFPTPPLNI